MLMLMLIMAMACCCQLAMTLDTDIQSIEEQLLGDDRVSIDNCTVYTNFIFSFVVVWILADLHVGLIKQKWYKRNIIHLHIA